MKRIVSFFIVLVFTANILLLGQENVSYQILPYDQKITIDGNANEKIWKQLPWGSEFCSANGKETVGSKFKAFADRDYFYLLLSLKGNFATVEASNKEFSKKNGSYPASSVALYFAPMAHQEDHYIIFLNLQGQYEDCYVPAKAGKGFPYSPVIDWNWDSKIEYQCNIYEENTLIEIKIPVTDLKIRSSLFNKFGFNVVQKIITQDEKKRTKTEFASWGHSRGEYWNTGRFGLIKGPLYQEPAGFTDKDLQNLDQMTNGMTALLKSLDLYVKAVVKYKYHIPEGTEVNGVFYNFDHIPMPQYPVKADGYYRFYNAFKYEPYKELADSIIAKLYQAYKKTKTADNQNLLLWNNLMSTDNKVHGYGKGRKIVYYSAPRVPFDQSKNSFWLSDIMFPDAFGQGFLDLSEIKDSLDQEEKTQIIEMLEGTLKFVNSPIMLVDDSNYVPAEKGQDIDYKEGKIFFWRIDKVSLQEPQPFKEGLKAKDWAVLASDIPFLFMALYNFDSTRCDAIFLANLAKFSTFYMQYRLKISDGFGSEKPRSIHRLDSRMLALANFAKKKELQELLPLYEWVHKELRKVYDEIPFPEYSTDGATKNSWSNQGLLQMYIDLNAQKHFETFWKSSFLERLKPDGILKEYKIQPTNFSSYPLYFDYAMMAMNRDFLSIEDAKSVFKKMFFLYGNSKLHRDRLMYASDIPNFYKRAPKWASTPYRGYLEGVLSEGIYANASSHAFFSFWGANKKNEFIDNEDEHYRNLSYVQYWQYAAPFQYHSDRFSYGKAESYCLLNMVNDKLTLDNDFENSLKGDSIAISPELAEGFPVFGHLDISDVYYADSSASKRSEFEVATVLVNKQEVPFRVYEVFSYDNPYVSVIDKAKLVFGCWSSGSQQEQKIEVIFKRRHLKQFFVETQ